MLQTAVGNVYKGLKAQQSHLQIKMPDVKSSVSLSTLSNPELEAAFSTAVQVRLTSQGWSKLDHSHLVHCSLWDSQAGNQQACSSVRISVACCNSATVVIQAEPGMPQLSQNMRVAAEDESLQRSTIACLMQCSSTCLMLLQACRDAPPYKTASGCMLCFESAFLCPGVVMLKLLDPKSMLPPNLQSIIEKPEDGLKDVESLRAVNRAVEGLPCSLMPDGRSGLLIY